MRFPATCFTVLFFAVLNLTGCTSNAPPSTERQLAALGEIDFNFHVKPILSQNCYACHGPDAATREADLRLDMPSGAYAEREDLPAVAPGQPDSSLLYVRITALDEDEVMPPPESHKSLSDLDIAILKKWIEEGAVYKEHWAFIPPVRPDTPSPRRQKWVQNEIDAFVLATMEQQRFKPSPEAEKRTLIRRLSFDLTGLPPSPAQVDAFLADDTDGAYETLVDRLLASPHFGERMALHWMDLARYADTNGYSIDGGRHMWLWRDWVIKAFNENKPYDDFIVEQLAGDLLPDPTEAQRIATGFNRNHMITHEGGTIPEENLTNYVADRVKTTGEVFMGLTMACAQCHDHKFDPISQHDYYRFFAFFNTIEDKGLDGDRGINSAPTLMASSPLLDAEEIVALQAQLATIDESTDPVVQELVASQQQNWETAQRAHLDERGTNLQLHPAQPLKITTPNRGNTGQVLPDGSLLIDEAGWLAAYNVSAQLDAMIDAPITGLRIVFYPHEVSQGTLGHSQVDSLDGAFVLTSLSVSRGALPSDQVDLFRLQSYEQVTASAAHPAYPVSDMLDERIQNGWSPHPYNRQTQHITVTFSESFDASETPFITAMLVFGKGSNLIPGHFKLFALTGTDDGTALPEDVQTYLAIAPAERTSAQANRLQSYFLESSAASAPLRIRRANIKDRLDAITMTHPTMVMQEASTPRATHVLNRGQYDQPLEEVLPGIPEVFSDPSSTLFANADGVTRLDLARWLTSPDHPLTARVTVNQIWQMLFGTGLVTTPADFGAQGALPSHPELLDWLAVSFIDSGWDTKALIKQIVMSATYRQQSHSTPQALETDPQNTYLARGPRFRLQAEFIRDAALHASGLLSDRIGGPSVKPYQPSGLWKEVSHYGSTPATAQVFVQDHGEKLYRRSMYTYLKRTAPPPSMITFDAPNREVCTVQRESTNTPLQALVLLNDPQFVEASRHLATRVLQNAPADDEALLAFAMHNVLNRAPDGFERDILTRRLREERAHYADHPDQALALLRVGDSPSPPDFPADEHAAWTVVCSLIMNLSESITRG